MKRTTPLTENQLAAIRDAAVALGLKTYQGQESLVYFAQQAQLLDVKQQDYGPHNISSFGLPGVLVRMNDKMERLKTLAGHTRRKAKNESVRDSLMDLCNYGVIGLMVEDNRWLTQIERSGMPSAQK